MRNEKGFTLIEIILAVFIFSLIGAVVAGGYIAGTRIKSSQEGVIEVHQNLRVALQIMSQDIRMCGYEYEPHWSGISVRNLASLVSALVGPNGSNSIQFRYLADTNGDGIPEDSDANGVPDSTGSVTYRLNANNEIERLYLDTVKTNPANADVIAPNIVALWITYLWSDGSWNPTPAPIPGNISTRAVGLTIIGESTNIDRNINSPVTYTEPNRGVQAITLNNQRTHRMISTVIELKNLNAVL